MKPTLLFRAAAAVLVCAAPLLVVAAGQPSGAAYDLVIANGRVMDPESGLDAVRHVGISGGTIRAIESSPLRGRSTIDAAGLVVSPGFIDLHQHGHTPEAYRLKAADGVTTALELEVGTADVDTWYAERAGKSAINYGVSIGHIPVRMVVMKDPGEFLPSGPAAQRAATDVEIEQIKAQIGRGLERGAVGVGFGIAYTPQSSRVEILEAFAEAGRLKAPAYVHMRNGDPVAALQEVLALSVATGAPLHVVHVQSTGGRQTSSLLRLVDMARARGVDVTTEMYPYTASATRIESALYDGWEQFPEDRFGRFLWPATGERLTRETFAKYRAAGGTVISFGNTEEVVQAAVAHPATMIASDGSLLHPRGSGSFARVLGHYVRDAKALTLMDALRKMTIMPARRLESRVPGMQAKGRLRVGADADITVFDAGRVIDRATYESPAQPSEGIRHVLVAGVPVVREGRIHEDVAPGGPIRGALATSSSAQPSREALIARAKALELRTPYEPPPGDPLEHHAGGYAKVMCSAVFVTGLDPDFAAEHVGYFTGPYAERAKMGKPVVDRSKKTVSVTIPNGVTRTAVYLGDQGCVTYPVGTTTLNVKPVRLSRGAPGAATRPWPDGDKVPAPPAGIDVAKVKAAVDAAFTPADAHTAAFVVTWRGKIIGERYGEGITMHTPLESWSMGKSVTATLMGVLIQQGAYDLWQPAPVPEWQQPGDPRQKIRIADILRMSSGLRIRAPQDPDYDPAGPYPDHLYLYTGPDAFKWAATRPLQWPPNTVGRYRNTDPVLINYLIRLAVERRKEDYLSFPQRALFDRIGVRSMVMEVDPQGNFLTQGYELAAARDWARLANLYLQDGVWNGQRILPEGYAKFVSTLAPAWEADGRPTYGGFFWINGDGSYPAPRDAYYMTGVGGQTTLIVPSHDLVVVRQGHYKGAAAGGRSLRAAVRMLLEVVPPKTATNPSSR